LGETESDGTGVYKANGPRRMTCDREPDPS
jgi:hypothetical protein